MAWYQVLIEMSGIIGAILAAGYAVWQKWFKKWATEVAERTRSTDSAVNHGRMPRIEEQLNRGSDRMDRIEQRIDKNAEHTHDRLHSLEEGQREMLSILRSQST